MDSLVVGLILIGLYCLPVGIALQRKHPQVGPIAVVNLLLGWTFLGWVVALAWAVSAMKPDRG